MTGGGKSRKKGGVSSKLIQRIKGTKAGGSAACCGSKKPSGGPMLRAPAPKK